MNIINGELELWIYTGNKNLNKAIIAVSNRGRIRRKDGTVQFSTYKQQVDINGVSERIYRYIANNFIQKTEEDVRLGRNEVDHITHYPQGVNINDVRNLRWCTHAENMRFPEARESQSKAMISAYRAKPQIKSHSDFGKNMLHTTVIQKVKTTNNTTEN